VEESERKTTLHNNLIRSLHSVVLRSDSSTITSLEVYIVLFTFRFLHNNLIRSLHRVVLLSDSSTITSLEVYIQEYFTLYQILWHCKYMLHYLMLSLFHLNWSKWSPELKDPWFPRINYAYRYPPPLVMLRVLVVLFKYSVSNKTSISTRIESLNSNTTDACVHLGFLLDL
jgi:hypothetical protein